MNSELLWSLLVKSSLVICLAGLIVLAMRRASGAQRHVVWLGTLAALLLLAVGTCIPRWKVSTERNKLVTPLVAPAGLQQSSAAAATNAAGAIKVNPAGKSFNLGSVVFAGWSVGCGLTLLWSAVGLAAIARLVRRGTPWTPEGSGDFRVLRCEGLRIPATAGVLNPVILMPAEADTWEPQRLRMALAHEAAHISRGDWLWQGVAQLACAINFYNPLVWMAARRLRAESETACDDLVLSAGIEPTAYAQELLVIARNSRFELAGVVGMARTCHVENRLKAIVDGNRSRRRVTLRTLVGSLAVAAVLIAPVAVLQAKAGPEKDAKEVLLAVGEHYKKADALDVTIVHHNSSGLFPGDYTQVLNWKKGNVFTLKVTKPAKDVKNAASDFSCDGTMVHMSGGTFDLHDQRLNTDPNISPGYEVSGGPILSWLLHSPGADMLTTPPAGFTSTFAWEPAKDWHEMKVKPIKMTITHAGTKMSGDLYLNEDMDEFVGFEWSEGGQPGYVLYTDQKLK